MHSRGHQENSMLTQSSPTSLQPTGVVYLSCGPATEGKTWHFANVLHNYFPERQRHWRSGIL